MNGKIALALIIASGALASPATANYFHNPYTGINLNVGSAPNPTPADVRENRLPVVTKDDAAAPPAVAQAAKPDANSAQQATQAVSQPDRPAGVTVAAETR